MLVADFLRRNARTYPQRDAVLVPGARRSSWQEQLLRVHRLSNALLAIGLIKGDRVAICAPNCGEYLDFFLSCSLTGLVGVPLNIRLSQDDLRTYVDDTEPSVVLLHNSFHDFAGWMGSMKSIRLILEFGDDLDSRESPLERFIASASPEDPRCDVHGDDAYQLAPTSGTTGGLKAVVVSQHNAVASIMNWQAEIPTTSESTNLQCIPMFFNPGGPSALHPSFAKGGRTVIPLRFDPLTFLQLVEEYKVSHTIIVTTMVAMLLNHPELRHYDLSSLRGVSSGGSPVPFDLLTRARAEFGDVMYPAYALAESCTSGLILRREYQDRTVNGLSPTGCPHPLTMARLVDEHGNDVEHDGESPGEIWLSGPHVATSYFRLPELTAQTWQDGWLRTGDIAVANSDGLFTIVDRLKDMIITGGINVFSREIEDAFYGHEAVAQAAVIGVPDEQWGERIHAVVQLREGHHVSGEELLAYTAMRLADFKKPRSIEFVDELPTNANGKILKRVIRERYDATNS